MFSPRPATQSTQVQRCLEMIGKVEDMVCTFQVQGHSRPSRPKVDSRPTRRSSDFSDVIPSLKKAVEVLKTRLSSSSPKSVIIPNFRRFKQRFATSSVLGPGFYDNKLPKIEQDHDFTEIPRLGDKIEHKLCTFKAKRKSLTFEETSRITIFDNVSAKTSKEIKEKARLHNERVEIAKAAAREIKEFYSENRKVKLSAKLQRMKWLENKEEIIELKKTWRLFLTCVSICSVLNVKKTNFKVMKWRSKLLGKVFLYCARFLGIHKKRLMKRRRKITYKNVLFISQPFSKWSLNKVSKFHSMIFFVCNKTNQVKGLFNLMFKWQSAARKVVKLIKSNTVILEYRKYALHEQVKKLSQKSRQVPEYSDYLRLNSLPYLELDKVIKTYIQERLTSYLRVSSQFSTYSKKDQAPSLKLNSKTIFIGSRRPQTGEAKFILFGHPLVLLNNLMRIHNQKTKKTIRFKV